MTLAATAFDDLRPEPELSPDSVRFVQTAGGQTGAPAPRRVTHPPFVKISSPTAWTTLELTHHADGTSTGKLIGCSPFPRHWIYDAYGPPGREVRAHRVQVLVPQGVRQALAVG